MHDRAREERALWKLAHAGYRVRKQTGGYLVTTSESVTALDDLVQIAAFADAISANSWVGHTITPSAELPCPKHRLRSAQITIKHLQRNNISIE